MDVDQATASLNDFSSQDDDDDNGENETELVGNPAPPPDVDLDMLRGDRIGDTVYSGKWCIKTVMKLMQSDAVEKTSVTEGTEDKNKIVDMEEELQNEVGALWDMTSNVEVCQYLQSVGAIESIYHVIANSRCPRATEMCVGMLANIATHAELWSSLKNDSALFAIMIPLLGNIDQPVLLEVMRFFNTALIHHDNSLCFGKLWEDGTQVTQELIRIMCGSRNGDLLKQTAELIYLLMCLDEEDARFNVLFADPGFIQALLEASKEIGCKQMYRGQNCLMEILHCFTTYPAGLAAIESSMEQIAEQASQYLKFLCHSLNLTGSSDIIATIISLLNHVFCRNVLVRVEFMSSSSLLHCVLKTVVAVYRKLGQYQSIAHPCSYSNVSNKMSSLTAAESQIWESLMDHEVKPRDACAPSWSERAGEGGTPTGLRTPEASPRHGHRIKELEVSWSERRISSPLTEDTFEESEESWKKPRDRRMKRVKAKNVDVEEKCHEVERSNACQDKNRSPTSKSDLGKDKFERGDCDDKKGDEDDSGNKDDIRDAEVKMGPENEQNAEYEEVAKKRVGHNDSRLCSVDSNKSGGFSPSMQHKEDFGMIEDEESKETGLNADGNETQEGTGKRLETDQGSENLQQPPLFGTKVTQNSVKENIHADTHETKFEDEDGNVRGSQEKDHADEDEDEDEDPLNVSDCVKANAKYQKLLDVVKEFLTDFFNNLRETVTTDEGVPVIQGLITYLNKDCRSTHLRAIIKCIGGPSQPVGRLLSVAKRLNATRLEMVLVACLSGLCG